LNGTFNKAKTRPIPKRGQATLAPGGADPSVCNRRGELYNHSTVVGCACRVLLRC